MKKYFLPEGMNSYKANLHCHSTVSDGARTPEEIKELYKKQGYSIVAYTDHNIMLPHPELKDEEFLPLTGVEFDISNDTGDTSEGETCHFNFIALDENMDITPFWNREVYAPKFKESSLSLIKVDESLPDFKREYTIDCISGMMEYGRENGFFVTYNHPYWSYETYPRYMGYHGMHAMEIINTISRTGTGIYEYNDKVYDEMLRGGKQIFCIAADDCHIKFPFGHRKCDACRSYTVIKAEKLDYPTISRALINGDFYSSEGPVIKSLWYEDGKVCIETEPVDKIVFTTNPGRGMAYFDESENGSGLTYAEHPFTEKNNYIRITINDKSGNRAYTNAYFYADTVK
jgi:hypothetical protein